MSSALITHLEKKHRQQDRDLRQQKKAAKMKHSDASTASDANGSAQEDTNAAMPLYFKSDLANIVDRWLSSSSTNNRESTQPSIDDTTSVDLFTNTPHPLAGIGATYTAKGVKPSTSSGAAQTALEKSVERHKRKASRDAADQQDDELFARQFPLDAGGAKKSGQNAKHSHAPPSLEEEDARSENVKRRR
jgi:hypothetical protein